MVNNYITKKKLNKYFSITREAFKIINDSGIDELRKEIANDFLDMAKRYYDDAEFFFKKGDYVNAFACLNYSYGWLDAGARIKLFKVKDSKFFVVD